MSELKKLDGYIEGNFHHILRSIGESLAIPSVKAVAQPHAPYGRDVKAALDHALNLGADLGFKAVNVDDRIGYIEGGEGTEMVGVLGHLDVVGAGGGWNHQPFALTAAGERFYGRGVLDDKGPIIGAIHGLSAIYDAGFTPRRRIRIILGCDEESGSSCVAHYKDVGEEIPTWGFTPDAEFPLIAFEKGQYTYRLGKRLTDENKTILRLQGGVAANAVPDYCEVICRELPTGVEPCLFEAVPGGYRFTTQGRSAHGATPELGENAIHQLFHKLEPFDWGELEPVAGFIRKELDASGCALGIAHEDKETGSTTVNLGSIELTPEAVSFTLDIRYPRGITPEQITARVAEKADLWGLEIFSREASPALDMPGDAPLVKHLLGVYQAATGDVRRPLAVGGSTYAKAFPNMVAFGAALPGEGGNIHQGDEYITRQGLLKGLQLITRGMAKLALV